MPWNTRPASSSLRMVLYSSLAAPRPVPRPASRVCVTFGMLDAKILPDDPHSPAAVMTKMLLDQVLFAPAGLLMCGPPGPGLVVLWPEVAACAGLVAPTPRVYVKALLGGYLLWPAAGILNFALLPPEYRLLFNNCVNVLWTCFLSIMSSSPETEEDSAPPAAAPEPAAAVAQQLAAAAVGAAVITASAAGPPSLGFVAGLAVAVLEAAFATTSSAATPGTTLELACVAGPADHQPSASPTFNVMDALCHELREAPMGAQP
ncbi:hypothetical protein TSOC_001391 [Tetrabaena socialis]|uniref:Protein SYM1 n=1 Tax=Tetrabaena socialis TaxID=47790 RepID=A0A2J8AGU9_9CHLO|nr:hypothetical protein TSOC_001391 [Tetrabaena socialis]|eukprot:PNH11749.1 hypothetical protein TSOC_001391 [Tetrabaena socialis]